MRQVKILGKEWEFDDCHLTQVQKDFIVNTCLTDPRIYNQWKWGLGVKINIPEKYIGIGDCIWAGFQREGKFKSMPLTLFPVTQENTISIESNRVNQMTLDDYYNFWQEYWDADIDPGFQELPAWWTMESSGDELKEFFKMCVWQDEDRKEIVQ